MPADVWQAALSTVGDDVRVLFDTNCNGPDSNANQQDGGDSQTCRNRRRMLEVALHAANEQRQRALESRWKVKKRNGDIIIVRDVFEKIVRTIQQFKTVGDAAAEYASEYAKIPWGVLTFLIKVSVDDNELFAAMIEGVESTTHLISRYAVFESVYLPQPTSARDHLVSSMVSLYASVLTFLATAHKYFRFGAFKRFVKTAFSSAVSDLEDALKEIERKQGEVDRTASIVGVEIMQSTAASVGYIHTTAARMASQLELITSVFAANTASGTSRYHRDPGCVQQAISSIMRPTERTATPSRFADFLDARKREEILDWLSPIRYDVHHLTQRADRLPDSGKWMFDSSEFNHWKNSSISATLWLHGIPGCGKTKLASAIIDEELERREQQNNTSDTALAPLAYFYCSRDSAEPERCDPAEVLRCIARQLCGDDLEIDICESLLQYYSHLGRPKPGGPKLSIQHTVKVILSVLGDNPGTIIVDALDECDPLKRYELFEALDTIVKESANVVKVLVTSRNDGDIVCRLRSTPNIYIDATKNKTDIQRFISVEVQKAVSQRRMLRGTVSAELQTQIVCALDRSANGMFRWVSLQIQNLCDPRRMKVAEDVKHRLANMSQSLSELYSLAFEQVTVLGHSSYRLALSCLKVLLVAARPLPWAELLYMLSCQENGIVNRLVAKEELLDIMANFLENDAQQDRPRFVHLSAREYLESRSELDVKTCNMTAAILCLRSIPHYLDPCLPTLTYPILYLGNHLSWTSARQRQPHLPLLKKERMCMM